MNSADSFSDEPVWSSGRVTSSQTTQIVYGGPAPKPLQEYKWRVRVFDQDGVESDWSQPSRWGTGFLDNSNWSASWIQCVNEWSIAPPGGPYERQNWLMLSPPMHLRRNFDIDDSYTKATVYATARGVYQLSINGQRVGDHELSPGWTDYAVRQQYQAFDVTDHLQSGPNTLGAILGEGWYAGMVGFNQKQAGGHWGKIPQLLVELHIEYGDGRVRRICTDELWKGSMGPRIRSDILQGELYISSGEIDGWDTVGYDDSNWKPVTVLPELGPACLVAEPAPPIRVTRTLAPKSVSRSGSGSWIIDFGEYVSGVTELEVDGEPGTPVAIRHGEWLKNGEVYTDNLHTASPTDIVLLRGGLQRYRPLFTQHAFQFVEVTNYPGELTVDRITALQFHTDFRGAGEFECSDPLLTQLVQNVDRTLRSNSMSIPTCEPARDERMAYVGDAQFASATAMYVRDHSAFYTKWMRDILDTTRSLEGLFANAAPTPYPDEGAPGWGDGGVVIPWTMYRFYGDTRVIDEMWDAMGAWMSSIYDANPDLIRKHRLNSDFNDWLVPGGADQTPHAVLATAWWAWCARLMAEMAEVTGRSADEAHYRDLASSLARTFADTFFDSDGRLEGDTQTVYAMAFRMGLVPKELKAAAAKHFEASLERESYSVRVGFAGVGFILPALHEAGLTHLAYRLLLNQSFPSWLYPVTRGATTIWERWDTLDADGQISHETMNAFSLVVLGSAVEWLYRGVAGIESVEGAGGMQQLAISPVPGPELSWAQATHRTPHGVVTSRWEGEDDMIRYTFDVPTNAQALITIRTSDSAKFQELSGKAEWTTTADTVFAHVRSGRFELRAPAAQPEPADLVTAE
ncbi:glycoside hydrolase family 78 protein [Pseudarthrobacter sp. R1]|nr:family 78 glycoside hydrolase catalytic domain [Pseudarthrobacter sp. R1]MCQ6272292.1 glycoside hydrolase family 78 protein [Pseudarthrobacter sp. R1]